LREKMFCRLCERGHVRQLDPRHPGGRARVGQ
jgi:hypothetical protein